MPNKVIGISGISGAGKTTFTQELAKALNATALFWDDFDEISKSPEDYVAWFHSGQGNEAWDYPALASALEELKAGQTITHPALNISLKPTPHIIFDAPMGHLHKQTGQYIDLWIHIHTPLDVALARRMIRDLKRDPIPLAQVIENLQYYLDQSRPLFFDKEERQKADHVIDGTLSIEEQITTIQSILHENS
jgi:uridine kinase